MEVFRIKQDCPYYPSEEQRFSVVKVQQDGAEELVECCLTQVEAALLVEQATRKITK